MAAMMVATAASAFAAITSVQINGGGNMPNENANGVPTTNVNPSGSAPPGLNK